MFAEADHTVLLEKYTYDVAAVRIKMTDEHGNILPFFNEPIVLEIEGEIEIIGPKVLSLQGGMGGTYIKTLGKKGTGRLLIKNAQSGEERISFTIKIMQSTDRS